MNLEEAAKTILSGLNSREKELYDLYFKKHLSIKGLSAAYGVSISAIKNRIYRLRLHIVRLANEFFQLSS